ncbi:MAG: hypothetical protein V3U75_11845, partial [Methylococcaceae bacterium]
IFSLLRTFSTELRRIEMFGKIKIRVEKFKASNQDFRHVLLAGIVFGEVLRANVDEKTFQKIIEIAFGLI